MHSEIRVRCPLANFFLQKPRYFDSVTVSYGSTNRFLTLGEFPQIFPRTKWGFLLVVVVVLVVFFCCCCRIFWSVCLFDCLTLSMFVANGVYLLLCCVIGVTRLSSSHENSRERKGYCQTGIWIHNLSNGTQRLNCSVNASFYRICSRLARIPVVTNYCICRQVRPKNPLLHWRPGAGRWRLWYSLHHQPHHSQHLPLHPRPGAHGCLRQRNRHRWEGSGIMWCVNKCIFVDQYVLQPNSTARQVRLQS